VTTRPYADAAWKYRAAGWLGVLPIGSFPRRKSPPPKGYTGWTGIDPSGADVQAWADGREGARNVGLHIPHGIVVPDVDAYNGGDVTLARLAAEVGEPLPPTWTSTARGPDTASRHHFFRADLPAGRVWHDHPGGHKSGIDALHVGHRYAVVWPSIHPDGGMLYEWYDPDGEPYEDPPEIRELTRLSAGWVEILSKPGEPLAGQAADDEATRAAVAAFRPASAAPSRRPCRRVSKLLRAELERIAAAHDRATAGGLHNPGQLYALTALGVEGCAGVAEALSQHQAAYVAARVQYRGESEGFADADWWRMLRGAVGKKLHDTGGEQASMCDCDVPARTGGKVRLDDVDLTPPAPVTVPADVPDGVPDADVPLWLPDDVAGEPPPVPPVLTPEEQLAERQRLYKRVQRQVEAEEEQERAEKRRIRLTPASAFRLKAVKWVWQGRVPLGEITLVPGREGAGKSTFLAWMAAAITRGDLPGMHHGEPRSVLYAAAEDSWEYTIAPRLLAAGADMDRVFRIDVHESDVGRFGKLSMPLDNRALVEAAHEVKAAVLMCDPIISIIDDKINTFKAQELRAALEPLKRAAEEAEMALVGLVHFNKSKDTDVLSMISGSRAWVEVARAVVAVAVDKDADEYTCVVSQVKNNLGRSDLPHLKYTIRTATLRAADHPAADEDVEIGHLVWTGESERGAEELLVTKAEVSPVGDVTKQVLDYVTRRSAELGGGRVPAVDVTDALVPDVGTLDNIKKVLGRCVARGWLDRPVRGFYVPKVQDKACPGCGGTAEPGKNFCRACSRGLDAAAGPDPDRGQPW
jgi:hypothetical protein